MEARAIPALVAIFVCAHSAVLEGNDKDGGRVTGPAVAAVAVTGSLGFDPSVEPWIHPKMDPSVRERLEAGFDLAVKRVRENEACADLFTRLGADGIEMLKTALYLPVHSYRHEVVVCGRNPAVNSTGARNLSYTKVGGTPTWICRHFSRVSTETAAVAVIHEALHHAGLREWPYDRMAMTSVEITEMVTSACGF
mgnify:CR=1 FL=1|jgi:hypothetical protein